MPDPYRNVNAYRKARVRRRRRYLLREIRGAGRVTAKGLWVQFCAERPDEAVSYEIVRRDLHALRAEAVRCPFCSGEIIVGEHVQE